MRAKPPPPGTALCRLDDIADPGAKGFVFGSDIERFEVFVVRYQDAVFGYINRCPHAFTPLDTFPDHFLTRERDLIVCSTHGALFSIVDGQCVAGPCVGASLTPIELKLVDEVVTMA